MKSIKIPNNTKKGYLECCEKGVFDVSYPSSKNRRGRVQEGGAVTPTLTAGEGNLILIDKIMEKTERKPRPEGKGWCWDEESGKWFRIRKLTPRECFRLMDCKESDIDKLLSTEINKKGEEVQVISNSQLYKCAGNSIVVACMVGMFTNLFFPENVAACPEEGIQLSLFD